MTPTNERVVAIADCNAEFKKWFENVNEIPPHWEPYYRKCWNASQESATAEIERLRGENAELLYKTLSTKKKPKCKAMIGFKNTWQCRHSAVYGKEFCRHHINYSKDQRNDE